MLRSARVPIVAVSAIILSFLVSTPAQAAGPWFVASTGGNNGASCLSAATPCATIQGVLIKPGFVNGDTINVAAGTYNNSVTNFTNKGANVVGQGAGAILDGNNAGTSVVGVTGAGAPGAAITVKLTNLTLRNGTNNTSFGGGLRIQPPSGVTANVTAQDVTITNNKSILGGGAVLYPGSNLTVNAGSIAGNTSTATANNTGFGGGVYVAAGATLSLNGTTVSSNAANGGAFTNAGGGGGIVNLGTVTVTDATFTGNSASGTGSNGGFGGGIYHLGTAPLNITNTSFAGGAATSNAVVGGAVAALAPLTATGVTASGLKAGLGGAFYLTSNATITNSSIKTSQATHASAGFGGGLFAARPSASTTSTVVLNNTHVEDNTATVVGGGMAMGFGVTTEVKGASTVNTNTAVSGGGIYNSGDLKVTSSAIDGNNASFQGGGIYLGSTAASDTPKLTLDGASVDNNDAAVGGGGLLVLKGATATATGGHLSGNSGLGGGAAAVGDGGTFNADGTTFVDNTAADSGGGAVLNSGTTSLTRSTLRGNHAVHTTGNTGLGGAIWSGSSAANAATALRVSDSTLSENDAWAASAILTYSTGSGATNVAAIDNTTISGNTTTTSSGAVQQHHRMSITNSTITNNTSASSSGALTPANASVLGVAGTIVAGNSGPECAAAPSDGGYNLTSSSDASCGFTAGKHDVFGGPKLAALADNGGPTKTHLPDPDSPALDVIPANTATTVNDGVTGSAISLCVGGAKDQRGTTRPQGAKCDIGSVEAAQTVPTVDGPASLDMTLNSDTGTTNFTSTGSPQPTLSLDGTLPDGVTFTDNGDGTAKITGTPTAGPGGIRTVTVKATNEAGTGTKEVEITLREAPSISGPSAATYTVGEPGGPDVFEQTGGFPEATLSTSSDLPTGVDFTPESGGKGKIAGTPANGTGGEYPITIKGDNGTGPAATWPFALTVNEASSLTGPANATFTVGTAGSSAPFTGTGHPTPELSATGLPAGLTISGTGTASITGNAHDSTGGEYDAVVKATNGVGPAATRDVHVTVKEAPELVGPGAVRFVAGSDSEVVYSSDGYPTAELTVSGDLPDGIEFVDHGNGTATLGGSANSGALGSYSLTVTASNGVAPDRTLHVDVDVVPPLAFVSSSLPDGAFSTVYSAAVVVEGGQPPYDFSLESGSLPAGLTLNSDGTITGSPTGAIATSTFTIKVRDSADPAQTATRQFTLTVGKGATQTITEPFIVTTKKNAIGISVYAFAARGQLLGGTPAKPLAGQVLRFTSGGSFVCQGTTDSNGKVECRMASGGSLLNPLLTGKITGTYAGNATWKGSTSTAGLVGQSPNP